MPTMMVQASGTSNSRSTADMASTYVSMESWVYPAFDRLAAEGYVSSAIVVPSLPQMTIRAEGLLSPHRDHAFPGFYYFNVHYLSGYTNTRQLMGSWIGREGDGEQVWTTWNLSPRSSIEASYLGMTVKRMFLEGGALRDYSVVANLQVRPEWQLRLENQAEWRFFLLSPAPQRNDVFTIQLSYRPIARKKT
jgi:Capsule assembly protein Wzi